MNKDELKKRIEYLQGNIDNFKDDSKLELLLGYCGKKHPDKKEAAEISQDTIIQFNTAFETARAYYEQLDSKDKILIGLKKRVYTSWEIFIKEIVRREGIDSSSPPVLQIVREKLSEDKQSAIKIKLFEEQNGIDLGYFVLSTSV